MDKSSGVWHPSKNERRKAFSVPSFVTLGFSLRQPNGERKIRFVDTDGRITYALLSFYRHANT